LLQVKREEVKAVEAPKGTVPALRTEPTGRTFVPCDKVKEQEEDHHDDD
jgi:hypothetical protein